MNWRKILNMMTLLFAITVIPLGVNQGHAQPKAVVEKDNNTVKERLRERGQGVQERRKKRLTYADRKAAAARAKALRAKTPSSAMQSPLNMEGGQK